MVGTRSNLCLGMLALSRWLAENSQRLSLHCDAHIVSTGQEWVLSGAEDCISGIISFALSGQGGGSWGIFRRWLANTLEAVCKPIDALRPSSGDHLTQRSSKEKTPFDF